MLLKSFSEAVRLNNAKGWKVRVKQGFTLIELLVVIAVVAILMATMYVGYNSVKSGAKVNNYVDFVTKMQGLVTRGISQCGVQQMQSVGSSIQNLTTTLQQCNIISNNVTIPTKYQDATIGINLSNIQSQSQYTLTLSGMSYKEANEVAIAIDSKYGQQVTPSNVSNATPCSANNGTVTCTFGG